MNKMDDQIQSALNAFYTSDYTTAETLFSQIVNSSKDNEENRFIGIVYFARIKALKNQRKQCFDSFEKVKKLSAHGISDRAYAHFYLLKSIVHKENVEMPLAVEATKLALDYARKSGVEILEAECLAEYLFLSAIQQTAVKENLNFERVFDIVAGTGFREAAIRMLCLYGQAHLESVLLEYPKALKKLDEIIDSFEDGDFSNSSILIRVYFKKINILLDMEKIEEASELISRTEDLALKVYGPSHLVHALCSQLRVYVLEHQGELKKAHELLKKSIADMENFVNPKDLVLLNAKDDLACQFSSMGNIDEALSILEETLKDKAATIGEHHTSYSWSLRELAQNYMQVNRIVEAESLFKQVIDGLSRFNKFDTALYQVYSRLSEIRTSQKRYDEAQEYIDKAYEVLNRSSYESSESRLVLMVSEAYLLRTKGDIDASIKLLQEAIKEIIARKGKNSKRVIYFEYELIKSFSVKQDWQSAEEIARNIIRRDPEEENAWLDLIASLFVRDDLDGADREVKRAINSVSNSEQIEYAYTKALFEKGNIEKALNVSQNALRKNQNSIMIKYYAGLCLQDLERVEEASSLMEEILSMEAIKPEERAIKACVKMGLEDYPGAIEIFTELIETVHEDNPEYFLNRAYCFTYSGDDAKALVDFNRVIEISPIPEAYQARASIRYAQGRYREAQEDYNDLLEKFPDSFQTEEYLYRGSCFMILEDWQSAYDDLSEAINLDKTNGNAYHLRAQCCQVLMKPVQLAKDKIMAKKYGYSE